MPGPESRTNHLLVAERFEERVRDTHQRAELIRQVLLNGEKEATLDQRARDQATAPQGTGTAGSAAE